MSSIERPDTKPLRAHYSTNTKIPKSRILLIKAEHAKKTGKLVKKARKDDSVEKIRADIDTMMQDAGAHTNSVPRSVKWAVFNFSFARFASDQQDEAFRGVLLRQIENMIPCECAVVSKSGNRSLVTPRSGNLFPA
jgi:hypothetical protein